MGRLSWNPLGASPPAGRARFALPGLLILAAVLVPSAAHAQEPSQAPPPLLQEGLTDSVPTMSGGAAEAELVQFTESKFDSGNVAWTFVGCLASLLMIAPGLLLFYAGLFGQRDAAAVLLRYIFLAALLSIMWALWGYTLAFSRNVKSHDTTPGEVLAADAETHRGNRFIGGWDHLALRGLTSQVGANAVLYPVRRPADRIPHVLFMVYQMMFFIAVPAPLVVALAGRLRGGAMALFLIVWGSLVYAPLAYWVWGGGWHGGALDTAGGIPAHVNVGFAALAAALLLSRQAGDEPAAAAATQPVYLGLGTALVWGGALIVYASRATAADGYAANAFVTTHLAACAGLIGWSGAEWLGRGQASLSGCCAGALAGLIAIASGSGYVAPQSALVIGLCGGLVCYGGFALVNWRFAGNRFLQLFSLHGLGGVLGALLTGVFASSSVAGLDRDDKPIAGLIVGDAARLGDQAFAVAAAAVLAFLGTLVAAALALLAMKVFPAADARAKAPRAAAGPTTSP